MFRDIHLINSEFNEYWVNLISIGLMVSFEDEELEVGIVLFIKVDNLLET